VHGARGLFVKPWFIIWLYHGCVYMCFKMRAGVYNITHSLCMTNGIKCARYVVTTVCVGL
jgi:hypothetical protein